MAKSSKDGQVFDALPHPESRFRGTIGRTYKHSRPDTISITTAGRSVPNVPVVLIHDCRFGQWSTFGGDRYTESRSPREERAELYALSHDGTVLSMAAQ